MPRYHGPKEQLDAARSSEASAAELSVLAESAYSFVQTAVAEHPNTEPQVLAELTPINLQASSDQYIAAALAKNENTPPLALTRLTILVIPFLDNGRGHHEHFEIGVALCSNSNTPDEAITILLEPHQTSPTFRKVVARETKREDVLRALLLDRSQAVRTQAVQTVALLQELALEE